MLVLFKMDVRKVGQSCFLGMVFAGSGCGDTPPASSSTNGESSSETGSMETSGTHGSSGTGSSTGVGGTTTTDSSSSSTSSGTDGTESSSGADGTDTSSGTAGAETTGPASFCGDGTLNRDEECDDRNGVPGDGCSAACLDENIWCEVEAVGSLDGHPEGHLAAADGFLYGAMSFGPEPFTLRVIDGTDPSMMAEVGSVAIDLPNWDGESVEFKDGYVATGGRYSGFAIVDVSDPESPQVVFTEYEGGSNGEGPVIAGDVMLRSHTDNSERAQIWDVTDMANPSQVQPYIGMAEVSFTHLAVADGYGILFGAPYLEIWDISTPATSTMLAQRSNIVASQVRRVVANADTVIVAGSEILHIDYSLPALPQVVNLNLDLALPANDIVLRGDLIYLPVANGLEVWDISAPGTPVLAGSYLQPLADTFAVTVDESHAYIGTESGLRMIAGLPGLCNARCGNSHVEYPENCDDGNLDDGDGCSALCGDE